MASALPPAGGLHMEAHSQMSMNALDSVLAPRISESTNISRLAAEIGRRLDGGERRARRHIHGQSVLQGERVILPGQELNIPAICASQPERCEGATSSSGTSADVALQRVQTSCTYSITDAPPALHIQTPRKQYSTTNNSTTLSMLLLNAILLCTQQDSAQGVLGGELTQGATALVTLSNSAEYLLDQTITNDLRRWEGLTSRTAYCARHGLPCVLALGRLNESTLRRDESCTEATLKVHVGYKALVLLALFQRYPKLSGAMYMDADAVIDAAWLRPQVYFELEPRADLIGTSNFNAPVLMNGGVLLLRNSPWTARFLSQWWQRRCAGKDQLALWHSIFAAWAEDIPWLRWPKGMWSKYKYALDAARRLALPYVASSHNAMRRALLLDNTEWKCNGTCNWLFERTGCLSQPLFLPHVLLLPVVPFRLPKGASHTISDGEVLSRLRARSSSLVPPLQHYSGHLYARFTGLAAEQLVCHVNERPSSCLHQQQGTQGLQHINLTKRDKRHLREMCDLCRTFARSIVDGRCSNRTHNKFYRCVCSNVLLPKFENVASGEGSFRHRWRCPDICLHLGSKL